MKYQILKSADFMAWYKKQIRKAKAIIDAMT